MSIVPKSYEIKEYIKADAVIDYGDQSVSRLADTLYEQSKDSLDYIRNAQYKLAGFSDDCPKCWDY